ncbi:hypothetical protein WN943_002308 [Citrus x changshan-huyou]
MSFYIPGSSLVKYCPHHDHLPCKRITNSSAISLLLWQLGVSKIGFGSGSGQSDRVSGTKGETRVGLELEPWSSRSAAGFSAADRWACSSSLRTAGRAAVSSRWLDAAQRQQIVDAARRQQIVDAAVDGWTQDGSNMTTARQQQIADAAAGGRTRNTAAADCGKERMFSCFLRKFSSASHICASSLDSYEAKALYSLSALDLVTTDCFLDDHDTRLFPK